MKEVKHKIKARMKENPSVTPSVVYNKEVARKRGILTDVEIHEFDQTMSTMQSMYPYREMYSQSPESISAIETDSPLFILQDENVCKFIESVTKNPNRKVFGFTSSKVLEKGLRLANIRVMDATFSVNIFVVLKLCKYSIPVLSVYYLSTLYCLYVSLWNNLEAYSLLFHAR